MVRSVIGAAIVLLFGAGALMAQDASKYTVKLVDPDKGKMLVTIYKDGGIKVVEFDIGKDTKFLDQNGKPLKGGLKSDTFKSPNARPEVPIAMKFNNDGSVKSIKLKP